MKMIILIVKDSEADVLTRALTSAEYRVTRIASTGSFLRSGVATLLLGVNDAQVDPAIQLVRETIAMGASTEKRVSLFVVPVERFRTSLIKAEHSSACKFISARNYQSILSSQRTPPSKVMSCRLLSPTPAMYHSLHRKHIASEPMARMQSSLS